ncbi:MAG: RpiB/LacA/LacB family sugar-phosphate isomerase [Patescibacteria group bacterium]|nr:RpiB/LacA/LacB family sugar-phosphate isomerase [bacterium]MDZ4240832.1 RpiB/LacA/LacB family sugar-phosphate isomerase [Patescibacteria group bacterium]
MKIALATDHAGFELKEKLKLVLENEGHTITDCGAFELNKEDDYPEYIAPAAQALVGGTVDRAIILGGSGEGEAMVANRFQGVRAVVYYGGNDSIIRLSREHNDANVLSLGARFLSEEEARIAVLTWLALPGPTEERHIRRVRKVDGIVSH